MFRLRTLGGLSLEREGAINDGAGAQRRSLALLALLAAARQTGISRDRLAAYLWPESDTKRARGALKQGLHVVRRQLETPAAVLGTSELRLNPACICSDYEEFLAALEEGRPERATALYAGPFLDGFHLSGAAEFDQWAAAQRAHLAHLQATALEQLARAADDAADYTSAVSLWRRLQAHDPFSARATLGLMYALDAAGERVAAIRSAAVYETLLREEIGSPPDPAVTELATRLRDHGVDRPGPDRVEHEPQRTERAKGGSPAVTAVALPAGVVDRRERPGKGFHSNLRGLRMVGSVVALAMLLVALRAFRPSFANRPAGDRSVAVLPFVNTDNNSQDDHFSSGLTDELIGALGKVEGLTVAARTSTFALSGRGLPVRAIADTLGVATVLEGTVRRSGDRLKVTAQLVNAQNQAVLWSETYDRRASDIFAVQEDIARAIVLALRGRLTTGESQQLGSRPTNDLEAYELYLLGRHAFQRPHRQRLEQSAVYYQRALERDPSFAVAYAGLAEVYVNFSNYAILPSDQAIARAKIAVNRALELDPQLAEAHASHAYVLLSEGEFHAAEAALRQSILLNPNYPWGHHFYTLLLMMLGRTEEAFEHNRHALALDPLSLPANATRGILLCQIGDYAAAASDLERTLTLSPDFTLALYYLGALRAAQGAYDEALLYLERAAQQAPDFTGVPAALAFALRRTGSESAADSLFADAQQRSGSRRGLANLAFAYAVLGRSDDAFRILPSVQWDVPALIELRADPLLAGLRADARYEHILRSIGANAR